MTDSTINKKLYTTFAELLKKNDDGISVTRLCEKADVARASFYLYYKDMEDFNNRILIQILQKLFEQSRLILQAPDRELEKVLSANNILFQQDDLTLLYHFTHGTAYLNFLSKATDLLIPQYDRLIADRFGENYLTDDHEVCSFFMSGFIPILYFDLLYYDKKKIVFEMRCIRAVANELFARKTNLPNCKDTKSS